MPASAASVLTGEVYEVHYVRTVHDAVIRVEVWRDRRFDRARQPVILTYSPYNSMSEPETARDSVGERYVPKGYGRIGSASCGGARGRIVKRPGRGSARAFRLRAG